MPNSTRDEIARLQEEYEKNPEGRLFVHLAEAYRRAGELEKAREVLNQGLERHSDYLSARIVLAQVETELGNSQGALQVWREVVELDPDNELALWALAELEYNEGHAEQSLAYYRRLEDLGVDDAELDEMISMLETAVAEGGVSAGAAAMPTADAVAGVSSASGSAANVEKSWSPPPSNPSRQSEPQRAQSSPQETRGGSMSSPGGPTGGGVSGGGSSSGASESGRRAASTENIQAKAREGNGTALAHTDAIGLSDLLVRLLEYRDATFHAGSSLTRLLAVSIGRELELDRIHLEALALAALLSDLGGLGLGMNGYHLADIQNPDERRQAEQREVAISLQLLHGITLPAGVHESVRHQHERWDGKGYPDGLREEEIPYGARVIAIARAGADYLTRAHESGGVAGALDELQRNAGSRYDPVVVSVLRRVFQRRSDHGIGFGLGGRIIVVHPEELRALGVATQLHSEGYVSEVVRDVGKARESIRRALPKAVVAGAGIPQEELSRLIRDVRANGEVAGIPLIAIDANDMDLRVSLLTAGADVCFSSEVTFREFKATLDALLRRREEIDRPQDRMARVEARL